MGHTREILQSRAHQEPSERQQSTSSLPPGSLCLFVVSLSFMGCVVSPLGFAKFLRGEVIPSRTRVSIKGPRHVGISTRMM